MKKNNGSLLIILAVICWSLTGLFTKHIPWNGFSIGIVRGCFAFVILMTIVRKFPKKLNPIVILTSVFYLVQGLLFVVANRYTSAANATVLQNTSPIYIMIMTAVIAKLRPKKKDVITCIIMLTGIVITFMGSINTGGTIGNISAIVSGVFYAGVYFLSRRPGADAVESTVLGNMLYLLLIPFLFADPAVKASCTSDWIYAAALGVLYAIAWFLFSKGIKSVDSLKASFLAMLEPVLAPIWTFIFIREVPGVWSIVGDVIVIGTLVVYQLKDKEKE